MVRIACLILGSADRRARCLDIADPHASAGSPRMSSCVHSAPDDPVTLRLPRKRRRRSASPSSVRRHVLICRARFICCRCMTGDPDRNLATLLASRLWSWLAYPSTGIVRPFARAMLCAGADGCFDPACRVDPTPRSPLALRVVKPMLCKPRAISNSSEVHSSMGPTAFLDMPWMPIFSCLVFCFIRAIGMTALSGNRRIIAITLALPRACRRVAVRPPCFQRPRHVLAYATQRNAEVSGLWHDDRFTARGRRPTRVFAGKKQF